MQSESSQSQEFCVFWCAAVNEADARRRTQTNFECSIPELRYRRQSQEFQDLQRESCKKGGICLDSNTSKLHLCVKRNSKVQTTERHCQIVGNSITGGTPARYFGLDGM